MKQQPENREGFSRDEDMEQARRGKRPAKGDLDATERSADRHPDEHIDYPASVDEAEQGQPDRDALSDPGE